MSDPARDPERLNSWKEIAAYLNVSVRTAQRWERTENLPARRHRHAAQSTVFAYRPELTAWWNSRPDLQRPVEELPEAAPSIAVLPLVNLNRDEQNEILCDGLSEELITALSQVEGLRVVARTSAFHFKGKTGDVLAIGARLGVGTVLEGSVRRAGERLRVAAQLIRVADGCHIWSERFDRRMEDIFELEEEIARAIVAALRVKLTGGQARRQYGQDLETYALYLEGRHHLNKRVPRAFSEAVRCFEQALARDPGMAPALAGLAYCYTMLGVYGPLPAEQALEKAKAAALKALEIDNRLADAHTSLGCVTAWEYDWAGAEGHFRRSLEANPNLAITNMIYAALVLGPQGRLEEADLHISRAAELDPLSPTVTGGFCAHCVATRDYDGAITACRRLLELDPAYPWTYRWLGEAYLMKGMYAEAEGAFRRSETPVFAAGFLGYTYARTGREGEARRLLRELEEAGSPSLACQIAVLHLGLGEVDAVFRWLLEACRERSLGVSWVKVEPIWDALRPDPRFMDVLKEMRLAG